MAAPLRIGPVPFVEAIRAARDRGVVLPEVYYGELQGIARATSFSVAGLASLDQLQGVLDSLVQALGQGETLESWKRRAPVALPAHRLENIFRTNVQGAYARGRCEHIARHKDRRPYLLYSAVNDSRTRPAHAAMHGTLLPADHYWWKLHTPPNGYQCRCTVISLTEAQAQARGGVKYPPAGTDPDPGWDYSPCEAGEGVERAMRQRQARCGDRPNCVTLVKSLQEQMRRAADVTGDLTVMRAAWEENFPPVLIYASERTTKAHPLYQAAKGGNAEAAVGLVLDLVGEGSLSELSKHRSLGAILLPVHAAEESGVNAIPVALAACIAGVTGLEIATGVVQVTRALHTGASGWWRIRSQPAFEGEVEAGRSYVLVDDFVGMGGTLANLRGYVLAKGGRVLGAATLTGKERSATLALDAQTLARLRSAYGQDLESWWRSRFGFGFDDLTESEAQYLLRAGTADTIRHRIAQAQPAGDAGAGP